VWSLAFRRDRPPEIAEVAALRSALRSGAPVVSTGLVLQELLQGIRGPKQRDVLIERFRPLPMVTPTRQDHIDAAGFKRDCQRRGVQLGTVDALLVSLCLRRNLLLLTTGGDFVLASSVLPTLRLWKDQPGTG